MRKGFTLIELITVIFIVGLLTTMSAAAIFSARNKRTAKAAAEQVKNVIMEAHAYAISPKTTTFNNDNSIDIIFWSAQIWAKKDNIDHTASSSIVGTVNVSGRVNLGCYNSDGTPHGWGSCFSFITNDTNKMGQLTDATKANYIVATKNGTAEKYKITVGQLSGNVTITKL